MSRATLRIGATNRHFSDWLADESISIVTDFEGVWVLIYVSNDGCGIMIGDRGEPNAIVNGKLGSSRSRLPVTPHRGSLRGA